MDKAIHFNSKISILLTLILIALSTVAAIAIYGEANNTPGVKITSHYQDQQVPIGELNVSGFQRIMRPPPVRFIWIGMI